MSPLEFEYLITRILDKMDEDNKASKNEPQSQTDSREAELEQRIKALEAKISGDSLRMKNEKPKSSPQSKEESSESTKNKAQSEKDSASEENDADAKNTQVDKIFKKLKDLESKIEENNRKIENSSSSRPSTDQPSTRIVNEIHTEGNTVEKKNDNLNSETETIVDEAGNSKTIYKRERFNDRTYIDEEKESNITPALIYKGVSAFTGVNFGGQTTWNFGAKAHYGFENNNIELLPELSFAPSDPISFGAAINAIHPFKISSQMNIRPYAGLGGGYLRNDEDSVFTGNIILGAYTNALGGRLYLDYTNRNLFNYNQIALGYRFNF